MVDELNELPTLSEPICEKYYQSNQFALSLFFFKVPLYEFKFIKNFNCIFTQIGKFHFNIFIF